MSTLHEMRPTWAEIDLRAFDHNVDAIVATLPPGSRLIAVMKGDAYGHGAAELARRCDPARVAMIATALLEEALELRRAGVTLPLLVLGPLGEAQLRTAAEQSITVGVPGPEELEAVAAVARERPLTIHLKLDTGMGRMGSGETDLPRVVELIRSAPRLQLEAIYTHFANASDPRDPYSEQQLARFHTLVETLREAGVSAPLHHVANSAGTFRHLVTPGDLARVGVALYGAEPLDEPIAGEPRLEPVMRWRTEIARLKELPAGSFVGYGRTWVTKRLSRIATLPVGYADGYNRLLSNQGEVLLRGRRVPVVGRVSMDLVTIDVTDVPEVAVGDEVILLGAQGKERITAEELAAKLDTISYEVLCDVGPRVPRVYVGDGDRRIRSRFE